jgi:phospholipid/cholesterol/gamma-HCH transport system substrate-binding protein
MENNANYALVGALSTLIVLALLGFVYWFAGPASNIALKPYNVVFTGAVSGVANGTDVLFNGIKVGQVTDIGLDPDDANRVVARVEVGTNTPVKADTKVLLGIQGLTGIGSVQFTGGSNAAGEPVPAPGETIPTLYAERSDFQSLLDGATATINGASTAVSRLNTFLDANESKLNTTVGNIEAFSGALASNSAGVETFLASISEAGRQIGPMAGDIRTLSADLRSLVKAIPPEQVTKVLGDVSTFSDSLARNAGQVDTFFATGTEAANNLKAISEELRPSVAAINQITSQVDPETVGRMVGNIDKFSTRLGENADNVDAIVANVTALSAQVAKVAADVDSFTASLSRNAGQVDGLFTKTTAVVTNLEEISNGLKPSVAAINEITRQVDPAVVGRMVGNIDKFSTRLGENADNVDAIVGNVTALSAQVAKVVADVDIFTTSLSRNAGEVDGFFTTTTAVATNLKEISDELRPSVAAINQITSQVDPETVGRVVANIDSFSSKLGENAGNVDTIVANVTALSRSLNDSATKVEAILARVDGVVANADNDGMFAEITEAAKSVRALANQLNASTTGIAAGLNNFTSRGLAEYSTLAVEARATLQRLDRVVRNLEANPQSLVFGGETVREYNKR